MHRNHVCLALLVVGCLVALSGSVLAEGCTGCPGASGEVSCLTVEQFQAVRGDLWNLKNGYGILETHLEHAAFTARRLTFRPDCRALGEEFLVVFEKARFCFVQKDFPLYAKYLNDTVRLFSRLFKAHVGKDANL